MGITVQQVGVLTCASRLCLRSLTRHRQLLDVELYYNQPLQVLGLIYKKYHGKSPAVVLHHKQCCSHFRTAAFKHETRQQSSSTNGLQLQQPTVAAVTFSPPLFSLSGRTTARPPRSTRGNATWGDMGDRGNHSGRVSTDTAVYKHDAGPTHLGLNTTTATALGLHRQREHHARASPS